MMMNLAWLLVGLYLFLLCDAVTLFDFEVLSHQGEIISLSNFKDHRVILVVNVASECDLTYRNYNELVQLHKTFHDRGFEILGFPCNQFGSQEPQSDNKVQEFVKDRYGVSFPVFAKVEVNGKNAIPLYKYLKEEAGQVEIQWNFVKFLVVDGVPMRRYGSHTFPSQLQNDIERFLPSPIDHSSRVPEEL